MSGQTTNYYLPYLRRGLAARAISGSLSDKRPMVKISLSLEQYLRKKGGEEPDPFRRGLEKNVYLYGPGDVLGFDARAAIRKISPMDGLGTFKPHHTPYVEFRDPDFLWRYSLAKDERQQKYWIPWLSLIVLRIPEEEAGEFSDERRHDSNSLPCIRIKSNVELPDLSTAWRWAHVHLTDQSGLTLGAVKHRILDPARGATCRLFCARELEANTRYAAFIIPTYRLGVEAALGQSLTSSNPLYAWESSDKQEKIIPYYHRWTFQTGERGDFEDLVNKIKPAVLQAKGGRAMRIPVDNTYQVVEQELSLKLEAALQPENWKPQAWGLDENPQKLDTDQSKLQELLAKGVQKTKDGKIRRVVVPPIYGRQYFAGEKEAIKLDPEQRKWLSELNLDFRHRIAAALGAEYIRKNQDKLMQAAWGQLRQAQNNNRKRNHVRVKKELSGCLHKRVTKADTSDTLQITEPLHSKILENGETVYKILRESIFPNMASKGKMKKYQQNKEVQQFLKKLAEGKTEPDQQIKPIRRIVQLQRRDVVKRSFKVNGFGPRPLPIVDQTDSISVTNGEDKKDIKEDKKEPEEKKDLDVCIRTSRFIQGGLASSLFTEDQEDEGASWQGGRIPASRLKARKITNHRTPLKTLTNPQFYTPMYEYLRDQHKEFLLPALSELESNTVAMLKTNPRFIEAFMVGLNHEMASELRWRGYPVSLNATFFRKFWDTTAYSVDDNEFDQFLGDDDKRSGRQLIRQLSVEYPQHFPPSNELMKQLRAGYSEDFKPVPSDKEEYSNDEEYLWAIVCDQVNIAEDTEQLKEERRAIYRKYEDAVENWLLSRETEQDIERIEDWESGLRLGGQSTIDRQSAKAKVVLLIRAELLRHYPNSLVYLVEGEAIRKNNWAEGSRKYPIFEGSLEPDILFLGFELDANKIREKGKYYIVFEERAFELRFGLDERKEEEEGKSRLPSNLSWEHFFSESDTEKSKFLNDLKPNDNTARDFWDNPAYIAKVFTQPSVRLAIDMTEFLTPSSST